MTSIVFLGGIGTTEIPASADTDKMRSDVLRVSRHPFVRAFQSIDVLQDGLKTPEQVLGEKIFSERVIAPHFSIVYRDSDLRLSGPPSLLRRRIGTAFRNAVPVLWDHESRLVACECSLPNGLTLDSSMVHESGCWFTFSGDIEDTAGRDIRLHSQCFWVEPARGGKEVLVAAQAMGVAGSLQIQVISVPCGDRLEDLGQGERTLFSDYLKLKAFMESPYIPTRIEYAEMRPKRAVRGRIRKPVRFVYLRSIESDGAENDDCGNGSQSNRKYRLRWVVRGHIRNQWYASSKTHKLIYVPPYVKGPKDAPMIQNVGRVVR